MNSAFFEKEGRILLLFSLLKFFSQVINAQFSSSFFKLCVYNEKDEILLVKWEGEWEVVGNRFNQDMSISEFLEFMSLTMGIETDNWELRAIFTNHLPSPHPTIMHYYSARYVSGEITPPEDCTNIGWFRKDEAMEVIPYPIMKEILNAIHENPKTLITAKGRVYLDKNGVRQEEMIEKPHALNTAF